MKHTITFGNLDEEYTVDSSYSYVFLSMLKDRINEHKEITEKDLEKYIESGDISQAVSYLSYYNNKNLFEAFIKEEHNDYEPNCLTLHLHPLKGIDFDICSIELKHDCCDCYCHN